MMIILLPQNVQSLIVPLLGDFDLLLHMCYYNHMVHTGTFGPLGVFLGRTEDLWLGAEHNVQMFVVHYGEIHYTYHYFNDVKALVLVNITHASGQWVSLI